MKTKTFTQRLLGCMLLAASTLTVQAAERLLIVGDGVWGGWSIDNSIVMMNDAAQPDVFTATVSLKANSDFKFLTETEWGKLEYRAGDAGVTLSDGVSAALVSSDDNSNDNKFQVGETANYSIVCDLAAKTVTVTKAAYQDDELKHTALCLVVFPCTEAEVIEDRLHAVAVLHLDVFLHILGAYPTVADILIPGYKVAVFIELNRSVVFPVPVLKLHAVNMQAVEIFHLRLDVGILVDGAAVVVELSHGR